MWLSWGSPTQCLIGLALSHAHPHLLLRSHSDALSEVDVYAYGRRMPWRRGNSRDATAEPVGEACLTQTPPGHGSGRGWRPRRGWPSPVTAPSRPSAPTRVRPCSDSAGFAAALRLAGLLVVHGMGSGRQPACHSVAKQCPVWGGWGGRPASPFRHPNDFAFFSPPFLIDGVNAPAVARHWQGSAWALAGGGKVKEDEAGEAAGRGVARWCVPSASWRTGASWDNGGRASSLHWRSLLLPPTRMHAAAPSHPAVT